MANLSLPFMGTNETPVVISGVFSASVYEQDKSKDIDLSASIYDNEVNFNANISASAYDGLYPELKIDSTVDSGDKSVHVSVNGKCIDDSRDIELTIPLNGIVVENEVNIELVSNISSFVSAPYSVMSFDVFRNDIDNFSFTGREETATVNIHGTSIDDSISKNVSIVGSINDGENPVVNINGDVSEQSYNVDANMTSYNVDLNVDTVSSARVLENSEPSFYISSNVSSTSVSINATIADEDHIVEKISAIESGTRSGVVTIFPSTWTLAIVNIPKDESGKTVRISDFVTKLKDKYGDDIYTKISTIIAKNPQTGEEFNYVVSLDYETPQGTTNDFRLTYNDNNIVKPVPFMVKSVSDIELSIDWSI